MAITINTVLASISNSAALNTTTSLVEDVDHVNLRVRAEIYHEGIVKATIEKPKGIADFDFGNILSPLVPGLKLAKGSGNFFNVGTYGNNLITSWAEKSGTWDTLDTTTFTINSAIKTAAVSAYLETNAITVAVGELYAFFFTSFVTSGTNRPVANFDEVAHGYNYVYDNVSSILMPITSSGTMKVVVGNPGGAMTFAGVGILMKITTNRATVGGLLAPYWVKFTEVYEVAGVTTTGATVITRVFRYVPAKGDTNAFTKYVMTDNTSLFANKTVRDKVTKFYTYLPNEYYICFFTQYAYIQLKYARDGGGELSEPQKYCCEGWGVVRANIGALMGAGATYVTIYIYDSARAAVISETMTIYADTSQITERVVLEYNGIVGGKEYLAFEGVKDISFDTIRQYTSGAKKNKKPLSFTGINRQLLETRFKDINNASYLKSLLVSENVKKLEPLYAAPTEVTVLTDEVKISNSELFTNQIDIEYEY